MRTPAEMMQGHGIPLRKPFSFEDFLAGAHDERSTFLGFPTDVESYSR